MCRLNVAGLGSNNLTKFSNDEAINEAIKKQIATS